MECNQGCAPTGSTGTPPVILGAWECDLNTGLPHFRSIKTLTDLVTR